MLSRSPVRSTVTLFALLPLLTVGPAFSNERPNRTAETTWCGEKSTKAKKIEPLVLTLGPLNFNNPEAFLNISATNKVKGAKGVRFRSGINITNAGGATISFDSVSIRTNRTGNEGIHLNNNVGLPINQDFFIQATVEPLGNNKLTQVDIDLLAAETKECINGAKKICLDDDVGVEVFELRGANRVPLDRQSSTNQEARAGSAKGTVQIRLFSDPRNPNSDGHPMQIINNFNAPAAVDLFQEGTGWRRTILLDPNSPAAVTNFDGPFFLGSN